MNNTPRKNIEYSKGSGKTELFYAIGCNDHSLVRSLIARQADVNDRCDGERTPLMYAAQHSDRAMIRLLIDHGARIDVKDGDGRSAADYAADATKKGNAVYLKWIMTAKGRRR